MKTEISRFLDELDRSPKTIFAYRNALQQFVKAVGEDAVLNTATYIEFLTSLQDKSPSTQRVYTTAVLKFYAFCKAGNWPELKEATQQHKRRSGKRIVNFNREAVEKVVAYCGSLAGNLETLRDRAFVLTLVDTGLRISEACALKRGNIDWSQRRAILVDKNKQRTVVRFSDRSIQALKEYLHARSSLDLNSRKPPESQPLFARHDIRASKILRSITPGGMWKAIKDRIVEAGVKRSTVRIHDFRHFFVTATYLASQDLKLSQELARHKNIQVTQRYTHLANDELDKAYSEIFDKNSK